MVSFKSVLDQITSVNVPIHGKPLKVYVCGILNLVLFGWGLILSGFSNDCTEDIIIGALQFILPVVGWIWSIIWGVLIILRKRDLESNNKSTLPQ